MDEQQAGVGGADDSSVTISAETAAKLNFAAHQSSFAFLRDLRVTNNDPAVTLSNVTIALSASPAFLKPKSWHLDRLAPSGTIAVKSRDVELDGGFLLNLTESIRGTVEIVAEQDGHILAREAKAVELLAYNEWGGGGYAKRLMAMVDHVIDTEGPIHEEMLVKRIARHHGFQRVRSQLREAVLAIARRRRGSTYEEDVGRFFWRKGTVRERLAPARHEGRDDELRILEFICREELKAIHRNLGLGDDPAELARRLGVARLNQVSRNRLAKIVR